MAPAFPPGVAEVLESLPPPAEDIWVRIRKGFAMPQLDDPRVAKWEQWYAARPDYVARMIDRSRRYLYHIVVEVEDRRMPTEVALLPMIESAYNPNAMSTSRASGIWQFIPSTGTLYGLKQNFWFDSRRDVIAGTEGALTYLMKLHGDFGDWQLALAAYNWGEGNVGRAIAKNQKAGKPADYASLKMPDETRNYLPKLQAVKNIISDPAKYGLLLDDIPDAPYFAVVKTTRKMDVKRAAELAEMPIDEFLFLNPHYNRPVIAGGDQFTIVLPIDKAELFAAKLDLTDQPLVSWQAYRMRNGRDVAAGRREIRDAGRDAARGQRARHEGAGAGRTHAARAGGAADLGSGGRAGAGGVHDGAAGADVLLPREPRRHAGRHREPVRCQRARYPPLERAAAERRDPRTVAAHHQRSRAQRGQVKARDRAHRNGDGEGSAQAGRRQRIGQAPGHAPAAKPGTGTRSAKTGTAAGG